MPARPKAKPKDPCFSSGPCAKRPGWSLDRLEDAAVGRSHRSVVGKRKLRQVIDLTRDLLGIPADYRIGIVPASDTGAIEMAMWSLLGARGVDVLAWESFGLEWVNDVIGQLKISDARIMKADYGLLPNLGAVDPDRDCVFTWNGTTSGVRVPDGHWIADNRKGLTLCDATSAVFAYHLPWSKLDVTTWSWQKVLGGEAQHGMLVLSPRAVERLQHYVPAWPIPKIFRLTKDRKLIDAIFVGETINTPSMLCVEDAIDGLSWAQDIGGLPALIERVEENASLLDDYINESRYFRYLATDKANRSLTSVCLRFADAQLPSPALLAKAISDLLENEDIAYDINHYRDAPAGLRIWCGATVQPEDIKNLLPWLDWAYETALEKLRDS